MSPDPTVPPADHGSDRYDYVEVDAPPGTDPPPGLVDALLEQACGDCRPNLFLRWLRPADPDAGPATGPRAWHVTVAHDETCPALRRTERGRAGGE